MANITNEIAYNTFVQGIITEAGPLTYPENASLDEVNFILKRDGSRKKRSGLDYEDDYVLKSTGFGTSQVSKTGISFHRWDYPKGNLDLSLGIVRIYDSLWFVNLINQSPSTEFKNGGSPLVISGLLNGRIDTAYINNELIIVGEDLPYPIKLEYDSSTDTVTTTTIYLKIRDFFGVDDTLEISDRPTTMSIEHQYNLINQGWNDDIQVKDYDSPEGEGYGDALSYTLYKKGWYPSNADIWYYGRAENPNKNTFGYYVPNELAKNSLNNSQSPQGSFIIDFKDRGSSRADKSGISLPLADAEQGNLTCIASFAGRLFYSGIMSVVQDGDDRSPNYTGYIFFTPTLFNNKKLDQCYQEADPTGEKVSDLIATDGGAIVIPEMIKVTKMVTLQDALIVFAENGIWSIMGGDSGFKASEYQVKKISDSGTAFPDSIVNAEGTLYFWGTTGIYTLGASDTGGLVTTNISLLTVQSLYNTWSHSAKASCTGIFEERNARIRWLINTTSTYDGVDYRNKYNYEFIYDISLGAFYPQKTDISNSTFPYIAAHVVRPSFTNTTSTELVVQNGVQVQENTIDVQETRVTSYPEAFDPTYLILLNNGGTFYFTFGKYKNTNFVDWFSHDNTGLGYDCFLLTGYDVFKDAMRKKGIPYLYMYFYQTEDSFVSSGLALILDNQSSCLVQAQWDWTNSTASGKWSTQFQAYRFKRDFIPTMAGDLFANGEEVVSTKNKLRGYGKSLSLYILAEQGKDLHLIGWAAYMTAPRLPI